MTAFLWKHELTYVSAPKVACTSLKYFFFEIENGFEFRQFHANGRMQHLHNAVYPTREFDTLPHDKIADHVRLTVVRDPVKMFISCYANRVRHHRELGPERIRPKFRKRGAKPDPSLAEFIDRIELYCEASRPIRHHVLPLVAYLGRDPAYYDQIYSIDQLEPLRERVKAITGRAPELTRRQTGGPKLSPDDLTAAQRQRIEDFYADDYATFDAYF